MAIWSEVARAVDMAGAATHAGLPRHAAENPRRTESQIAEIDQIGFATAARFGAEYLARLIERILVEFGFRRQCGLIAVDRKSSGVSVNSDQQTSERYRDDHP